MSALENIRHEWRPLLALAWPLVIAEIGWNVMGIVDTIMVGRLPDSAAAIGAVSLGSILFVTCALFGGCLLLGLDTVVSQAHGAGPKLALPAHIRASEDPPLTRPASPFPFSC